MDMGFKKRSRSQRYTPILFLAQVDKNIFPKFLISYCSNRYLSLKTFDLCSINNPTLSVNGFDYSPETETNPVSFSFSVIILCLNSGIFSPGLCSNFWLMVVEI